MTGTCKLCLELIFGAPVAEVGPEREKAEFLTFAEAMRAHVGKRHPEQLQVYGALLTLAAAYLATTFADCQLAGFAVQQAGMRDAVVESIRDAQVVISAGTPVQHPLSA